MTIRRSLEHENASPGQARLLASLAVSLGASALVGLATSCVGSPPSVTNDPADGSMPSAGDGGQATTEGGDMVGEGGRSATDGGQRVTDGGPSANDGGPSATDGGPPVADAAPTCAPSQTRCVSDAGLAYCGSTQTDNANCGHCGHVCDVGSSCSGGSCVALSVLLSGGTDAEQTWTVPSTGYYQIQAIGGGGCPSYSEGTVVPGGPAAEATGTFLLTAGTTLTVLVAGPCDTELTGDGGPSGAAGGGGGGTFVVASNVGSIDGGAAFGDGGLNDDGGGPNEGVLVAAGGGGGAGTDSVYGTGQPASLTTAGDTVSGLTHYLGGTGGVAGGGGTGGSNTIAIDAPGWGQGGGGYLGNGVGCPPEAGTVAPAEAFENGAAGGMCGGGNPGAFGCGGGGGVYGGGGGGGYSGGGGGCTVCGGGGGGSFLASSASNASIIQAAGGQAPSVTIMFLHP